MTRLSLFLCICVIFKNQIYKKNIDFVERHDDSGRYNGISVLKIIIQLKQHLGGITTKALKILKLILC